MPLTFVSFVSLWFIILSPHAKPNISSPPHHPVAATVTWIYDHSDCNILGLGIGANTAIFSLINGVLLKPLPNPQADRLIRIYQPFRNFNRIPLSYPDYLDFSATQHSFDAYSGLSTGRLQPFGARRAGTYQRFVCLGSVLQSFRTAVFDWASVW